MTPQTILPSQSEEIISIQEALHILRQNIPHRIVNEYPIHESLGKYLAEDIEAPEPSPRFNNSAMDGFAVRWEDVARVKEGVVAELRIIGESQAGIPFDGEVVQSTAVRISTGAMLPDGADTVVRVEDTEEDAGQVSILTVKKQGQDVRHKGEEFAAGQLLFLKGDLSFSFCLFSFYWRTWRRNDSSRKNSNKCCLSWSCRCRKRSIWIRKKNIKPY